MYRLLETISLIIKLTMKFTFPSEERDKDASVSGPSKQSNFHLRFDIIPQRLSAVGGWTAEEEGQLDD